MKKQHKSLRITLLATAMLAMGCAKQAERSCPLAKHTEYGPYTIDQIEPRVWHLRDCNGAFPAGPSQDSLGQPRYNNCSDMYLLTGETGALLIDLSNNVQWSDSAATSLRHIVDLYKRELPLTITFTHNHGDHIGMLPAYIGDTTVQFALPKNDFADRLEIMDKAGYFLYEEGHTFDLGELTISTIEVGGHTPGSMVFSIDGRNILLTGDAIGSGHGVWIFDAEGFSLYKEAVPHLLSFVREPQNGIDTNLLRIYGGHDHQKQWLYDGTHFPDSIAPLQEGEELGMTYLRDMELAVREAVAGTARTEPFEMTWRDMDTYFIHGSASIVAPHNAVRL